MRLLLLLLLNGTLTLVSPIAHSNEKIQDWVQVCEDRGEFSGRCFISQTLHLKQSGKKLFQIAAGYPFEEKLPLILVSAPLGIYLPAGISLQVDKTELYKAAFAYCNLEGCHAYYRLTPRLLSFFRGGRWLNVVFQDGTRREHQFKVSLNGFTVALRSLKTN